MHQHCNHTLADGNIFEVRAKGKHVSVVRLDINMDAALGTVEVWSRPGDMVPNDDGGWFLLKSFDITGQGKGNITSLPAFEFPIVIPPGSKQSFYVTTTSENADLWYSVGELLGSAYASNKNLEVLDAYAVGYYFKGIAQPRRWNGMQNTRVTPHKMHNLIHLFKHQTHIPQYFQLSFYASL